MPLILACFRTRKKENIERHFSGNNVNKRNKVENVSNQELELAWKIVERTGANLFLTGKAGTGKTTFLKKLKEKSEKRMVVLAPTGIAAINAGGVTIHSFFPAASVAISPRNHV